MGGPDKVPAVVVLADPAEGSSLDAARALESTGHVVHRVSSPDELFERLASLPADLVLLDGGLPGGGVDTLGAVKKLHPSTLVAFTSERLAVDVVLAAFRAGAVDCLEKPIDAFSLAGLAARAGSLRRMGEARRRLVDDLAAERERNAELRARLGPEDPFATIIGTSVAMRRLVETLREVARTESTVLLTGESGTGKGLAARAIHEASARRGRPFVEANCVVYTEGLLHSELFGHERGSFTGATRQKKGRFELAAGGTLFLDEIGEISPATQLLLLRVLQERTYERVGGEETLDADVRLIAATNRDLGRAVETGRFRADLYYRLHVIPVNMPPLRERLEDVPVLARHLLDRCLSRLPREIEGFEPEALGAMSRYAWPGNVREMENVIERSVVLARGRFIALADLPDGVRASCAAPSPAGSLRLRDLERERILEALREALGNKKLAASKLGIHRSTLYAKMRRHGLDPESAESPPEAPHDVSRTPTSDSSR